MLIFLHESIKYPPFSDNLYKKNKKTAGVSPTVKNWVY
jgi:hypothetical protein